MKTLKDSVLRGRWEGESSDRVQYCRVGERQTEEASRQPAEEIQNVSLEQIGPHPTTAEIPPEKNCLAAVCFS